MSLTAAVWVTIAALWGAEVLRGPARRDRRLALLRYALPRIALIVAAAAAMQTL
jgi:hypothetical protein